MKSVLFLSLIFLISFGYSQSSLTQEMIVSTGEDFKSPSTQLSWTIGQILPDLFEITVTENSFIGENPTFSMIKVFPNPAQNRITIQSPNNLEILNINLFSLEGKEISTIIDSGELNVSSLSEGMYLLRIQQKNAIQTFNILIQH